MSNFLRVAASVQFGGRRSAINETHSDSVVHLDVQAQLKQVYFSVKIIVNIIKVKQHDQPKELV